MRVKKVGFFIAFAEFFALFSSSVFAATYTVDPNGTGDYPTIQAAINAAVDGDHVIIYPGVYDEFRIRMQGKQISVRSIDPNNPDIVDRTILAPIGFPIFNLEQDDYPNASIEGITVCDQYLDVRQHQSYEFQPFVSYGGSSSNLVVFPVVKNCVFRDITSRGIFWLNYASIKFEGCKFINNTAVSMLFYWLNGELILKNCLIADNNLWINYVTGAPPLGFCIQAQDSLLEIDHCTIAYNRGVNNRTFPTGENFFSMINCIGGTVSIRDSILYENNSTSGDVVNKQIFYSPSFLTSPRSIPSETIISVSHSNIQSGLETIYIDTRSLEDPNYIDPNWIQWGSGNMDADPLFVRESDDGGDGWFMDLENWEINPSANNIPGDFHLKSQSGRFVWEGYSKADYDFNRNVNLLDFSYIAQNWLEEGEPPPKFRYPWYRSDLDMNFHVGLEDIAVFSKEYLQLRVFGAWVQDDVTSPCIDAGDPNDMDWQNELWPHEGRVNMGAYGGTPQASMSLNTIGNPADLNHDDVVDVADWCLWSSDWLDERVLLDSDFDRDNDVDPNDMTIFMNNWLWGM